MKIKKLNEKVDLFSKDLEKRFGKWIVENRHRIILIISTSTILLLAKDSFGLRLFLDTKSVIVITTVLALLVLKIKSSTLFVSGLSLFPLALILLLFKNLYIAEIVGNAIYGLFLIAVIRSIFKLARQDD